MSTLRSSNALAAGIIAVWTAVNLWRALVGHFSLGTNAFDLSVFDYALWGLLRGATGVAPFFGHSEFSDHFEPVLMCLLPAYAPFQSATALVVLQVLFVGAAGWLFVVFQRRVGVVPGLSIGLLIVYLLARRSHSATVSFFYPECLQPLLTLAVVLCWDRPRWKYWTCALLLLATKEDMSIALAGFALWQWWRTPAWRGRTVATCVVCASWFAFAMLVAIPASRAHDGLAGTHNPVFEERYASDNGAIEPAELAGRVFGGRGLGTAASVLASAAFLPIGGLEWLLPALPGAAISLAAKPGEMQSALTGHYVWPILPWLFMAAAVGLTRFHRRLPQAASVLVVALVAWTLFDSPTIRGLAGTRRDPRAAEVLSELTDVPGGTILAQANLIPHIPKSTTVYAVGADQKPQSVADWVLLTPVGSLWPLDAAKIDALIEQYRHDGRYEEVIRGPLFAFKRRGAH